MSEVKTVDRDTIRDPRVISILKKHKPMGYPAWGYGLCCPVCLQQGIREDVLQYAKWPCSTAENAGAPTTRTFTEALAWWWTTQGLDPESALTAARVEVGPEYGGTP